MIKHLDCTFRDGGYYNNWEFPIDIVNDYLNSMVSAGIDIVEIGFRSIKNEDYKGAFAYSKDELIESFQIPTKLKLAVMVNANELKPFSNVSEKIKELFPNNKKNSKIDLIRIACHANEYLEALKISSKLKDLGFEVAFNLMQIADVDQKSSQNLFKRQQNQRLIFSILLTALVVFILMMLKIF